MNYDYKNSHFSDEHYQPGDFVLSSVKKSDLKRFNIQMSVKDFKEMCNKKGKYKVILTGGLLNYRKTRVFNYYDYENKKSKTKNLRSK